MHHKFPALVTQQVWKMIGVKIGEEVEEERNVMGRVNQCFVENLMLSLVSAMFCVTFLRVSFPILIDLFTY